MHDSTTSFDARGCSISGATSASLAGYERSLSAFQSWRAGADAQLAAVLQQAPRFVMAHVLQAYLFICSRDQQRVRMASPVLQRAAALPANERERMHIGVIAAVLADDYELAGARLDALVRQEPRDVLALQVGHAFDYLSGATKRLHDRVAAVLPVWSTQMPGYHAVLAMHAFGLVEAGEYSRAEHTAQQALAINPQDARAHHVMAHVFEMSGCPELGEQWMSRHISAWACDTVVANHCWWHLALHYLAQGQPERALSLYDQRLYVSDASQLPDLIDASALLWRLQLHGLDIGARWGTLAAAWELHLGDAFCSFSDLHAMLAFVGAGDWDRVHRLKRVLVASQSLPTRYGHTTRQVGLPACRGLAAFGRGEHTLAITLLSSLPELAHRLGGSHAQRDVLYLTLLHAIEGVRRPVRRLPVANAAPPHQYATPKPADAHRSVVVD